MGNVGIKPNQQQRSEEQTQLIRRLLQEKDYLQRENQHLRWTITSQKAQQTEKEKYWLGGAVFMAVVAVGVVAVGGRKYNQANRAVLQLKDQIALTQRTTKVDIENAKKFGIQRLATSLIEVADNLSRATSSIKATDECNQCSFSEGVKMTEMQFLSSLKENGVEIINPVNNDPFDPNFHEAVAVKTVEGVPSGHVVEVMQPGWSLNADRILRPARVVVAKQQQ
mmetsp:Transcript_1597/g.1922  ORF Transcript_1597/g.1922 Transcript_1597/m.1922 type:complete len:224 (+) Transcript_1597:98-769(+)